MAEEEIKKQTLQKIEEAEIIKREEPPEGKLNELLENLNLEKRHLGYFCCCALILAALITVGIFYGPKLLKWKSEAPKKSEAGQEASAEDDSIKGAFKLGKLLPFPLSYFPQNVFLSNLILGESQPKTGFSRYVLLLRRMQNAYGTDLNFLLSQSADREHALNAHLVLLKKLAGDAEASLQKIKQDSDYFGAELEKTEKKQDALEKDFFDELDVLSIKAGDSLSKFISQAKISLDLKARFKAFERITHLYETAVPRMKARIQAIELNREALLKGIKVYDVEGSDLKLILPVETKAL